MDDSVWQAIVAAAPHLADYLRLGTLLMPGGGGSEITSEAVHTFLSLVSLYSDSVMGSRGGRLASHKVALRGGVVVTHWTEGCLEGCRRLELLVEMLAERTVGRRKKFPLLLYLEIIKALCKLYLCRSGLEVNQRSNRMNLAKAAAFRSTWQSEPPERFQWWMASSILHILRPVLYLFAVIVWGRRSWKPWLLSLAMDLLADMLAGQCRRISPRRLEGAGIGRTSRPVQSNDDVAEAGVTGPSSVEAGVDGPPMTESQEVRREEKDADDGNEAKQELEERVTAGKETEGVSAIPPRDGTAAAEAAVHGGDAGELEGIAAWQVEEVRRRRAQLLLYLLRSPAFETVLEPAAGLVRRGAERVPLVGSLAGVALDMLLSLHRYHFYNAGS